MGYPLNKADGDEAQAAVGARELAASGPGPSPRKLIAAGIFGVFLLTTFFMSGTFTAVSFVDTAAVEAEIARATVALRTTQDPGRLAAEYLLSGAHIILPDAMAPGEVSLPLEGRNEVLAWMPRRFASEAFASVAPARLGLGALVIAVVAYIMFRLHRLARNLEERRLHAHEMATRDPLTGLRNRLTFDQALREAFAAQTSRGPGLAILYLDLDGFKAVNDRLGHVAGDNLLRQVGVRLLTAVGPNDTVARLGGDEFAIIRREQMSRGALAALAICLEVALSEPFDLDGPEARVGVSIGIACAPADARNPGDLVHAADAALYRAKAEGGARFAFAGDHLAPELATSRAA